MKNIKIVLVGFLIVINIASSCENKNDEHEFITFVNKSDREIACQQFWSGHITEADTLYQCRIPVVGIPADSQYNFPSGNRHNSWEIDFKVIPYIQFLIMEEIYREYITSPCDTIRKYVPILHCYQLTLEDLQRMNWTVVYPPEE